MKLLGWVHRKFRQNSSSDPLKNSPTGPTCNCLYGHVDGGQLSPVLPAIRAELILDRHAADEEPPFPFEGLLSIGTLGFAPSPIKEEQENEEEEEGQQELVETIAEREESDVTTETDLMVVNSELEKALAEAVEKEGDRLSLASRPSHVSGGACPLQEFLLGGEEPLEENGGGKRASLGELFMIEKGGDSKEMRKEGKGRDVNEIVKKMINRCGSRLDSRKSAAPAAGGGAAAAGDKDGAAAAGNAKFRKIMQMFHKKIHPENSMFSKKHMKPRKYKNRDATSCSANNCTKETDFNWSPEHWIRTDADYLVLEL